MKRIFYRYWEFLHELVQNHIWTHQPTIGVLLCTDTDSTIARYFALHDSDQLFAATMLTNN